MRSSARRLSTFWDNGLNFVIAALRFIIAPLRVVIIGCCCREVSCSERRASRRVTQRREVLYGYTARHYFLVLLGQEPHAVDDDGSVVCELLYSSERPFQSVSDIEVRAAVEISDLVCC